MAIWLSLKAASCWGLMQVILLLTKALKTAGEVSDLLCAEGFELVAT
jgi:hypothetical protein